MKKPNIKISTPWLVVLNALVLFVSLWLVWYLKYQYVLRWLEGYSYWSPSSDISLLSAVMPSDVLKVVGAYLLQFFYYPVVGAAIQALLPVVVFLACVAILWRLCQNAKRLLWLPLLPAVYVVANQFWDSEMTKTLGFVVWTCVAAGVVLLLTLKKHQFLHLPTWVTNAYVSGGLTICALALAVYLLGFKKQENQIHAYYCQLECLAEDQQWDELLAVCPPETAQESFIARRFALLALLEKGRLAKEMFNYGVQSDEDLIFKDHDEPICRHFNALLFRSLNMPNENIRQSFQQQIQSSFGTNFNVLRRLAETNLQMKNYPLAKKYLDILSQSTVMKYWAAERRPQLEAIKHSKPNFEQRLNQFYSVDLLPSMGAMADRYPKNHKYADLLLCGLLAKKSGDEFYPAFQVIAERQYAHGEPIPAYYQQALMMIAPKEPEVLQKYKIDAEVQQAFNEVMYLVKNGQAEKLRVLLPNSFWAYFFA